MKPETMQSGLMKPSQIVHLLDQALVGQADAKKILAVAVYSHFEPPRYLSATQQDVPSNPE